VRDGDVGSWGVVPCMAVMTAAGGALVEGSVYTARMPTPLISFAPVTLKLTLPLESDSTSLPVTEGLQDPPP
jgi:hypothetical protein